MNAIFTKMDWWTNSWINKENLNVIRTFVFTVVTERKIFSIEYLRHVDDNLAIAAEDGTINVIDARGLVLVKRTKIEEDDGPPVQLFAADNLLYVLTHHGNVYCLDCRLLLQALFTSIFLALTNLLWFGPLLLFFF